MSDIPPLTAQDRDTLIRTMWGECGGAAAQPIAGIVAAIHVVRNRARKRKTSAHVECMRPMQFSGWNKNPDGSPQQLAVYRMMTTLLRTSPAYMTLGQIVDLVWDSPLDFSDGALHYANLAVADPPWAKEAKRSFKIGDHTFFTGVRW